MLRKKMLLRTPEATVAVAHYAPGERHNLHTDNYSRVSVLLRGGNREENRYGVVALRPGDVLLKSNQAKHEDEFGDEGASIAAIEFLEDDPFEDAPGSASWRMRADAFALAHAFAFLEAALAGDGPGAVAAGVDVVTASEYENAPARLGPTWLNHLKLELEEFGLSKVDVAARARAAGAHPAHASRLFRRHFGSTITEHAQAHGVRRAIGALGQPHLPLSEVALVAGFYDQSHMTRVFQRVLGRTPGEQRTQIAAATC